VLLFWGHNPLASSPTVKFISGCDALQAKARVVDPRKTWLAQQAQVFLQLRPALTMRSRWRAERRIADGTYASDFIEKWIWPERRRACQAVHA
jgi:hypothetical protein